MGHAYIKYAVKGLKIYFAFLQKNRIIIKIIIKISKDITLLSSKNHWSIKFTLESF